MNPTLRSSLRPLLAPCAAAALAVAGLVAPSLAPQALAQQAVQGLPRVSPHAHVEQTVGVTTLAVDYHRPAVNDRDVWGALVPYDQIWRAGANENTTFETSHAVEIGGKTLHAGIYGLHVHPRRDAAWTVIFSHDSRAWGSYAYDASRDALRVDVEPAESTFVERLAFRFENPTNDSVTLALHWADLSLPIAIEVDTVAHTLAHIQQELTGVPQFFWQGWNSAAAYCVQVEKADDRCLGWADRSIGMSREFQNLMTNAALLRIRGDEAEAAALEKEAIPMGTEAQINRLAYEHLYQRRDVDAALALFRQNAESHPDSWNAYDSLGEALAAKGDTAAAIESYQTALEKAPEAQQDRIRQTIEGLQADD